MSWFLLKDQPNRRLRKGIWLRVRNNDDVTKEIKKSKLLRPSESVQWIAIKELQPDEHVLLEVWARSALDSLRQKWRYNVFHIHIKENPEWVCEGDLGRGLP